MSKACVVGAVVVVCAGSVIAVGDVRSFTYVPPIPGSLGSVALGLSANGEYVVGSMAVPGAGYQPFRWNRTVDADVQALGASGGHILGDGVDISDDGSTVVGVWRFATPGTERATHAFKWKQLGGYQFFNAAAGQAYGGVKAASASGTVMVGMSANADYTAQSGGRWTNTPAFLGTGTGTLYDVSANGAAAAGVNDNLATLSRAVRWTSTGAVDLGVLAGTDRSIGYGITRDGTKVVGTSTVGPFGPVGSGRAFMWTSAGMQDLGGLAGATRTALYKVSDAGTVGIGWANFDGVSQSGPNVPVIWRAGGGFMTASSFIAGLGLIPGGMTITELTAISGDGKTIVGYGSTPIPGGFRVDGFVLTVPGPGAGAVLGVAGAMGARRRRR